MEGQWEKAKKSLMETTGLVLDPLLGRQHSIGHGTSSSDERRKGVFRTTKQWFQFTRGEK